MKIVTGFFMAWGNFCAIPCPHKVWDEKARKHMLVAFPLVGLVIGILWAALWVLCREFNLKPAITAVVLTAYPFMVSGFIHLDGFMDCNDAILSRRPLEQRQKILKDSHVGAFAVIATILMFLAFFSAQWTIGQECSLIYPTLFMVIPVVSRAAAAVQVLICKPLSTSQYDQSFNLKENKKFVFWIVVIGFVLYGGAMAAVLIAGYPFRVFLYSGICGLVMIITSAVSGMYGRKQLGGMSGDISGYSIVFSELAAVLTIGVMA